jgi:hypothetical protein
LIITSVLVNYGIGIGIGIGILFNDTPSSFLLQHFITYGGERSLDV